MPAATDFGPLPHDRLRKHCRRSGPVAGLVIGFLSDLPHHLGAHILELVLQLDLLRHGYAVLCDAWRSEALVKDHVAALRAQRDLDGIGQDIDAAEHLVASVPGKFHVFGSHFDSLHVVRDVGA